MTLADLLAGVIVGALNAYVLLAGADFGGGVWDLLASGPRKSLQRDLVAHAMGPVWEANHVWLILAVVLLFTCFPAAFARLGIAMHIPLSLVLIGIVLRGAAFAFLAAVYLTLEAEDPALREDFRRRAIGSGVALFCSALAALLLAQGGAPRVLDGLVFAPWALPLHLLTAIAAITALGTLWRRHYRIARIAAAGQVTLIFWGWPLSQYPYIVPPDLDIADAAAPDATLRLVLGALALGAVVLVPSLYVLFRVFKRHQTSDIR